MFDNVFVFLSAVTDSEKNPVMDNHGNPIESRTYSDLLAKFMKGIPAEFQVSGYLRDNARRGLYSVLDSDEEAVKDSKSRNLNGRGYSTEQILDNKNNPIPSQAIFVRN